MKLRKLFLLMPFTIILMIIPINANANASTWKYGTPKVIRGNWISNYLKLKSYISKSYGHKHKKVKIIYERYTSGIDARYGFNFNTMYYTVDNKLVGNSSNEGAGAAVNPHYIYLGKSYYKITSGSIGKNSLNNELHTNDKTDGSTRLIKVNNKNRIKIWNYKSNSGHGIKLGRGMVLHRVKNSK